MPITKTALENERKSEKRRKINQARRTKIKNAIKGIRSTIFENAKSGVNPNSVIELIRPYVGKLFSHSRHNHFDKLRASRVESRSVALIKKLTGFKI